MKFGKYLWGYLLLAVVILWKTLAFSKYQMRSNKNNFLSHISFIIKQLASSEINFYISSNFKCIYIKIHST